MKTKFLLAVAAVAMEATSVAYATQWTSGSSLGPHVANTSNKGSLLIFPLVTIDPSIASDTTVQISNDQITPVVVECEYINQQKARVDFIFTLSGKATASWDVGADQGDTFTPPQFPGAGPYPQFGNSTTGELVCFAVNNLNKTNSIVFNYLSGTATVNAVGSAIKYSAWSFLGYGSNGDPTTDGYSTGTGTLALTGGLGGDYDACPLFNETPFVANHATVGNVTTIGNYLAVSSCNQDLRRNFQVHTTNLVFNVSNSMEVGYSGANICVDSTALIPLIDSNSSLKSATNFDFSNLGTAGAAYDVTGTASDGATCNKWTFGATQSAGLLGVVARYVTIKGGSPALIGGNTHASTTGTSGFVYWDAGPTAQVVK